MKTLKLIILLFSISYSAFSQSNSYIIRDDITPGVTWHTSGHITCPDALGNINDRIIVSTEINGVNSFVRIQPMSTAPPLYADLGDRKIILINDNETAIDFEAEYTTNNYILAANTTNPPNPPSIPSSIASGILSTITPGLFTVGSTININILDPSGDPFDHTYILDMAIGDINDANDPAINIYIVGYIADGTNSVTSMKKPFIACYDVNFNFLWSKVIDRADRDNVFSSVVICPNYGILASGCTRETLPMPPIYPTSRMVTSVLFSSSGTELNSFSYYSNGANAATDADYSRVADLLYQEIPSQNINPSVVILTYNDIDQSVCIARLDLNTFTVANNVTSYFSYNGNSSKSVGFTLHEIDYDGQLAVTGYDYAAPLMSITNPNAFYTFIAYHDPTSLNGFNYLNFDIDNTGYEFLSNDAYYQPMGASYTAPDGFFPEMSINITDGFSPSNPSSFYIGSTRKKLLGIPILHNTVINNYNAANPANHCVLSNIIYNNYSMPVYPLPLNAITTTTFDLQGSIIPSTFPRQNGPIISCPIYGNYKQSGTHEISPSTGINIYPNSTRDYLMVDLLNPREFTLSVKDINGRSIPNLPLDIQEDKIKIWLAGLIEGIYFLDIYNSNNQTLITKKFIKE